jgi:hypothetical protein
VPLIVLAGAVAFLAALGGNMRERAARQPQRLEERFSGSAREPAGPRHPIGGSISVSTPTDQDDELDPIDFLAIEFPGARISAPGFEQLLSLADQGVIAILDLEFIAKDAAGNAAKADVGDLASPDGVDLSAWAGASSGLLDRADVDEIAAAIEPGSVAAVIVYENRWVHGLVSTWRRDGARLIADGGISAGDLVAALDATEPS